MAERGRVDDAALRWQDSEQGCGVGEVDSTGREEWPVYI